MGKIAEKQNIENINENDHLVASKKKVIKMRKKMQTAFAEIKANQKKLNIEDQQIKFLKGELEIWQKNFLSIFDQSGVAFFSVYHDMTVKEVNGQTLKFLGYDRFEMLGQPMVVFAEPECREKMREYFADVFQGSPNPIELNFISNDNRLVPVMLHGVKVHEQANEYCICSVADLSGRKKLESKIEHYKAEVDTLVEKHTSELNSVLEKLQGDLDGFEQNSHDWKDDKQQLERTIADQVAQIENIKAQMNDQQVNELKKQCIDFENQVKQQAFEIARVNGDLSAQQNANAQLNVIKLSQSQLAEQKQKLQTQLKDKNDYIQALKEGLESRIESYTKLEEKFLRLKQKFLAELTDRTEKFKVVRERYKSQALENSKEIEQLAKQLEDNQRLANSKNNELAIINERLQKQVGYARLEGQEHQKRSVWLDKQLKQAQDELLAIQKELEIKVAAIASNKQKYIKERDELVGKLTEKSDELDFVKEELSQQSVDIKKLNEKLSSVQCQLAGAQAEIENGQQTKQAVEHKLALSRMMLEKLCDVGAVTMNVYNVAEKKLAYVNRHIGTTLGYSDQQIEEMGTKLVSKLMHPEDFVRINNDLKDFSWNGYDQVLEVEYRLKDVKNKWHYIHSQEIVLERDENDRPIEVFGIQYDYTDRVEAKKGMDALSRIVEIVGRNNTVAQIDLASLNV